MKILLIHQYFLEENDGGGSRFNEMARQWTDLGHEVIVIAGMMHANGLAKIPEYKGRWFLQKFHENVEVWRCHVSEAYNNGFLGRLWGYFSFVFSSVWAGIFKVKGTYDVILVTSPPLFVGITAFILSKFKRTPFVFEVRDLWPESAIDTGVVTNKMIIRFAFWFERFIYKRATLINVLTPAFKEKLINEKQIPEEKIIFIPNAADFSISDTLIRGEFNSEIFRREIGWDNKLVITYVGAHGVANHLIQMLKTAQSIKDKYPDVLFVLIGNGMQKALLKEYATQNHLANVQFIDSVPKKEVFKYILASDFGASVLKKVDTFKTIYSNKTFDYMSCKKPILVAIDGVSRQLIKDANCGYYIEPENIETWTKVIERCKNLSTKERKILGDNGYKYAQKHFDRSKLAKEYINHITEKVLNE